MELAELVRARNHLHAAGLDRGVGERNPGGHLQGRLEAEVGRILVPAHIGRVARVLGPDREMEQRISGPITAPTASRMAGWWTISSTQVNRRCGLKLCPLVSSLPWAASNSSMARRYRRASSAANASIG